LYAENMKMIQIRNVPDELHGTLKARAAREGKSLSDYLKKELEHVAERPTLREWLDQTRSVKPVLGGPSSAELVRAERDGR
jgi:predicted RNA-binding Zn ribbon-like protein